MTQGLVRHLCRVKEKKPDPRSVHDFNTPLEEAEVNSQIQSAGARPGLLILAAATNRGVHRVMNAPNRRS